jgi:hypothetical protein
MIEIPLFPDEVRGIETLMPVARRLCASGE